MTLAKLQELIRLKDRPETTLSLETAIQHREQTVARYRFTPSIRDYFTEILSLAASDRGQGYWVQAEYGAGKTHFLATLAVLLSDRKGAAWGQVRDNDIKGFASAFQKLRFFPILLNCKGRLATEGQQASLQRVFEQAIAESLTKVGLQKQVTVGTADEIQAWWQQAPQGVKGDITHAIQSSYRGRPTPDDLLTKQGPEAFAKAVIEAARAVRIEIPFTKDIHSRFLHIYRQLTRDQGLNGLLVIVDEFKSWQDLHPQGSQGFAEDEHVLETLAFHLPVDEHARIVTVVASQAPPPAKLMGGARGDRFKMMSLFAGEHSAWEYDAIVADVVREVRLDRLPEVNAYYDHYYRNYSFLKQTKREYFQQIFPFQPRCFEIIRNLTKRELATTRSSIHYVHEVLDNASALNRQGLIKVADLLDSPNLIHDLQTAVYHEAYQAYQSALSALTDLFDEDQDLQMAREVLKTLFLWYCAFKEIPRGMTATDLAEACLADHEFLKKEDHVEFILGRLRDNQVIEYPSKERGAFFRVSASEGPNPVQILARIQRTQVKDPEAKQHWETLLTASAPQAGGLKMLFQGAEIDRPHRVSSRAHKVKYDGECAVVRGWSMVWGNPVVDKTNYDLHFRIVCLLDQAEVDPQTLHDDRIAVVIPGKWEDIARDVSRRYTALVKMKEEYQDKQGPDAEDIKRFIDGELQKARGEIVLAQKQLYRAGRIVTRAGLGIDPNQAFADPDKADELIASALLAHAYTSSPFDPNAFKRELSDAEAGKVFNALFGGSTQSVDLSAVENFGLGLGLTSTRKPREFDPVTCAFFTTIRNELTRAGGELRLYTFYEKYTAAPYGLLEDMVTLYLLAFVRFAQPHCYLTVKPEIGLKLKTGKAPLDNRLGPADVVQVAWARGRLHRALDSLVQAVGPSWNDLVEFARVFDDSLKATTERQEVETQQDRLFKAQQQWHEKIERVQPRLQRLAQATNGDVQPYIALLSQVDLVCCATSLEGFEHVLKEEFARDKEQFGAAVEQVKALDELDRRYAQALLDALAYLAALEGIPEQSPLAMARDLIQHRFELASFCKQPSQAGAVLGAFEQCKQQYSTLYQIHYREYRQQLATLEARLQKLARKVEGLGRMNQIDELGGAVCAELPLQYKDLLARCNPKNLPEELPDVNDHPIFRGITLSTGAPKKEVADFEQRLEHALHTRFWQLADETITAILQTRGDTPLQALLDAIQAADALRLAEHFTTEVATLVSQVLHEARLVTVDVRLADYDGPAQLGENPQELEEVLTAFRSFLARKLDEARQANPGKTVRLHLKSA
jgi:hypothetical protein